jgi:hypothetical protein
LSAPGPLYLGGDGGTEALNGVLNEVRLWTVERTQQELNTYSDATNGTLNPQKYLACYWNLRQNATSQEVADLSKIFPWQRSSGFRGFSDVPSATDPDWVEKELVCLPVLGRQGRLEKGSAEAGTSTQLSASIHPNPFSWSATLFITSPTNELADVTILEPSGRVVAHWAKAVPNQSVVVGEQLAAGLYFVRVVQNGQVQTLKLVKQ